MAELIATERSNIVAIADEIRALSGGNSDMTLGEMIGGVREANDEVGTQAELIQQIASVLEGKAGGSGGNTETEDGIIGRSISGAYTNSTATNIGEYAFANCINLTSASFDACTNISNSAFLNCTNLESISLPSCESIGSSAFYSCSKLKSVNLPACTNIDKGAFQSCSSLTSVNLPACVSISSYAFSFCYSLAAVNLSNCKFIGEGAFAYCHRLSSIILAGSSVCRIPHTGVLTSTPFSGYKTYFSGTPYIYVPESLINSYKYTDYWLVYSKYFSSIESLG